MIITLDNACKMEKYIKLHISKAFNIPMLEQALHDSLRLLDKYHKKEYPEVRVKSDET